MSAQTPAQASARRLEKDGFHPKVTTLSPEEYFEAWVKMKATLESRPNFFDTPRHAAAGLSSRQITMVSFLHLYKDFGLIAIGDTHISSRIRPQEGPGPRGHYYITRVSQSSSDGLCWSSCR